MPVTLFDTGLTGTDADWFFQGNTAAWPITADASGRLHTIWVRSKVANTNTTVKVGVYTDGVGAPGTRLGYATAPNGNDSTPFSVDVSADAIDIVASTNYYIAMSAVGGSGNFDFNGSNIGADAYMEVSASDFPSTWPGGGTWSQTIIQFWGTTIPDAPAVSPDILYHPKFLFSGGNTV